MGRKRALLMGAVVAVCLAGAGTFAESLGRPAAIHVGGPARVAVQEPVVQATVRAFESVKQAVIHIVGF